MKTLKRRRKEMKTDYNKRIKLLKGKTPRLVFRKSNKYILSQYVISNEAKDRIIFGISSKKLLDFGWPKEKKGSLKSIPASYLTGITVGKKIIKDKLGVPVIDLGMIRKEKKNRAFAFIKGLIDSGVKIKSEENIFPVEERITGKHLKNDFSQIFSKIKKTIMEK